MTARIERGFALAIVLLAALAAAIYAARPITTWDFWWHVKAGEEILRTRSLPATDPFSHTAGALPWVNHEWLFDVLLVPLWSRFGAAPIRALCGIVLAGTVLLVGWMAWRRTRGPAITAVLVLAFLGLYFGNIQVRPQILSYPFYLLFFEAFLFRSAARGPARPALIAAGAALMVFWSNIHAVALLPLIVYGVFIAAEAAAEILGGRLPFVARPDRVPWRRHLLPFAVLLAATFVNVNGIHLHAYALEGSSFASTFVSEWAPFYLDYARNRDLPRVIWAAVIASMALSALWLAAHAVRRRPVDVAEAAVIGVTFYFVLTGRRWLWMAIVPMLIALAEGSALRQAVAASWAAGPRRGSPEGARPGRAARRARRAAAEAERPAAAPAGEGVLRPAAGLAAMIGIGAVLVQPFLEFRPLRQTWSALATGSYLRWGINPDLVPGGAASLMRDAGVTGNLFNFYGWGGFLLYTLYPECRVFVDGRAVLFGKQVIDDAVALTARRAGASDLLERYRIDMTVMPEEWTPPAAPGATWIPFYRDASSAVFGRAGSENAGRVAAWYARAGIPFDPRDGFVEGAVVEASPDWARGRNVLKPDLMAIVDPLYEVLRTGGWRRAGSPAPFRVRIAEAFIDAGLPASAARELREALKAAPDDRFAVLNLANVEIGRRRGDAAREVLSDWLVRNPSDAEARKLLERALLGP